MFREKNKVEAKETRPMYAGFLFLLLVFLIPNSAHVGAVWIHSPELAFLWGVLAYALLLAIIHLWGRSVRGSFRKKQERFALFTQVSLIAYLSLCFFGLQVQRLFLEWSDFQFFSACWALSLYLLGLWTFHRSSGSLQKAKREIRFLIPFALPFLLFTLLLDIFFTYFIDYASSEVQMLTVFLIGFLVTGSLLIFFPALIQLVWDCKPLADDYPELAVRLEALCKKADFKHAGLKIWTVMNDSLTAAIIGIVPRFRYILFTKKIIRLLSPESIEAILAHEIGHSYRRHLLLYPLIIAGMTVGLSFFSYAFEAYFTPFIFFILYAFLIALYLRVVFGFFSRNFERQADLHVFELGIQPRHMIDALHQVAVSSGNIHLVPSWHHYSIQERIDFLHAAMNEPRLIESHHRFVKKSCVIFIILLTLIIVTSLVSLK